MSGLFYRETLGYVAVRIMRWRLVGDDIRHHSAYDEFGIDVGGVGDEAYGLGFVLVQCLLDQGHRFLQVFHQHIHVRGFQATLSAGRIYLHNEPHTVVHGDGQGLSPAHSPKAGAEHELALQAGLEMRLGRCAEGLIGALEYALRADVDPAPGSHLAVHHEAHGI